MEKTDMTVRKLAQEADVSPTTIQELRSGKKLIFLWPHVIEF